MTMKSLHWHVIERRKKCFPCKDFATPIMLPSLRKLGLRKQLTRAKILECATSLSVEGNDNSAQEKDYVFWDI